MNPQFKMLVWKQWRERRGQLWLCVAMGALLRLGKPAVDPRQASAGSGALQFIWEELAVLYIFLVPLLIAMRTACGESTDHTASFTRCLPLARGRASFFRLAGGALVLVAPIALAAILATVNFGVARSIDPALPAKLPALMPASWWGLGIVWAEAALLAIAAVGCYAQLCLLGTLVERENQLAFLGAVWTILCFFAAIGFQGRAELVSPHAMLLASRKLRGRPIRSPSQLASAERWPETWR